jgi:hypothetical protein
MNQMVSALQSLAPDAPDSTGEFRANPLDFVPNMPIVRFSPPVFGFPDRLMTKLRYHQLGNLTSTLGAVGTQVFRWNSIYDPDATGVGHQPLYRDQLAGIYDHYSVVRARAQLRFTNDSADPFAVGALTDDDTTGPTSIDTLCEQSHGLHAILSPLTGSRSSVRFQLAWDCQKILGIDPFNTQGYKTTVANNPTEESDLICWAADLAGSTAGVLYDIEIEYEVLWTELADPGAS